MSAQALLSVVIPAYNAEPWIAGAIESVAAQSYPAVECVVVDDGSTDGTPKVVAGFARDVTVLRTENRGVSAARNAGIAASGGEYVGFLDADDEWLPEKAACLIGLLRAAPNASFAYGRTERFGRGPDALENDPFVPPDEIWSRSMLLEPPAVTVAFGIVKRELLDEVGWFDEALSTSADADLTCRLAARSQPVGTTAFVHRYRQHAFQMHREPRRLEHDHGLMLERFRAAPADPRHADRLYRRGSANLSLMLGIAYARGQGIGRGAPYLARAARKAPVRTAHRIFCLARARRSRRRPR